ncbi:MAG: efflux RND transporter permease subunit, partial [Sphaerospermopsis sp. SIO1G2]|nr:efflux RND transporter permease subunit [Sphaerospermopsis sp. SIO1G2]
MFADFFIRRSVFTTVCAIIVFLIGAICIPTLPIAQYPEISPTQIIVTSNYIGASAEVVESTVTSILERQINGIDGIKYITSSSSNDGTSTITVTFDGTKDKDIAAVDVLNRVSLAEPQLPEPVIQTGVTVSKQSNNILLAMGLYSESEEFDNVFLSNYTDLYVADALKRLPGVSEARIFGERRYAMRLWLDPNKLASRQLTTNDVVNALNEQNIQVGVGQIGQEPAPKGQMYQVDLRAISRLTKPEEFEDLVIRTAEDGSLIKLQDVGRAELGAQNYSSFLRFKAQAGVGIGIFPAPGSNVLDVARRVKKEMVQLSQNFPPGVKYNIAFDTTTIIEGSLAEVVKTLLLAIALVVLVIFIFLQDWRTTLIPVITIPLALIGTFAFIKIFNFSINTLTMFGLTLATGMVVDDAIIVVENISRLIQEEKISPHKAASVAMSELSGAVLATSLVLMAVFVPVAFFPGSTGNIYRQFALTIAFSITISTFLALTLTPSIAASILRVTPPPKGVFKLLFGSVNQFLDFIQIVYRRLLLFLTRIKAIVLAVFMALILFTVWLYSYVPSSFLPDEDQGYFITIIQAPEGSSLQYTSNVMSQVEQQILSIPEITGTFAIGGFSFSGNTANSGVIFSTLKSWDERKQPNQSVQAILGQLRGKLSNITEASVFPVNPPAIRGLGSFSGFQFQLQDVTGTYSLNDMLAVVGEFMMQGNQNPALQAVFSTFKANTPQIVVEVDRKKAKSLQVPINDIFSTIQTYIGSRYVNDFNFLSRTYRVYVQAESQFRSNPNDINSLYVRSQNNQMIPLGSLVKLTSTTGPQTINHYNLYRSIEINGSAAPGFSSGQATTAMEQL